MRGRAIALVLALAGGTACSSVTAVSGSGTIIESQQEVGTFDSLEVGSAFDVTIRPGDQPGVLLRTDDNLLGEVEVDLADERLRIDLDVPVRDATLEAEVTVGVDRLRAVDTHGAATVTGIETLTPDTLTVTASGASRVFLVVDVQTLTLSVDGASVVNLGGETDEVSVAADGASTARLTQLVALGAEAEADGASRVGLTVTEALIARAGGASTIRYAGEPTSVDSETSGASTVQPQPTSSG